MAESHTLAYVKYLAGEVEDALDVRGALGGLIVLRQTHEVLWEGADT
jgi:hypothetical protein